MVKSDRVGTFLYRSIVEAHPDIVVIPVMPSIEQRIGVIWKKGKYQNATTEKVIKFNIKLDIENPIIRINTAFKGCSSLEKISVLPRIYHN